MSRAYNMSYEWLKQAIKFTLQSEGVDDFVWNDDCDNCALHDKGCAKNCARWPDMICNNCPCLASKFAKRGGELRTVHPRTLEEAIPLVEIGRNKVEQPD